VAARTRTLLRWFDAHRRPLPWRRDRDPYRIWVAEVLLQQTRVAQALPYYERFLDRYPTLDALAHASPASVLKAWEGAGYYARARNLHAAAREIVRVHHGRWPSEVEDLERLPGIGPYIARAVASLAFDRPVLALEANGLRVAARWWLERGDLRSAKVRGRLEQRLLEELPRARAGAYNEALMELGETICTPTLPRCDACPVANPCEARARLADPGSVPRPRRRGPRPHVVAAVAAIEHRGRWLVQRRPATGLLGGLWEFPGGKVEPGERPSAACRRELEEETGLRRVSLTYVGVVEHAYSHFSVTIHVFRGRMSGERPPRVPSAARWLTPAQFDRRPRPKATEKAERLLVSGATGRPRASRG
jgi:A/G-specific adenine glycosylase